MKRYKLVYLGFVFLVLAIGCSTTDAPERIKSLTIKQSSGKSTYWVLPGQRKLSPTVFGGPGEPINTFDEKYNRVKKNNNFPPSVPQLLDQYPFLIGVPMKERRLDTNKDEFPEDQNWMTKRSTMFSNTAIPVKNKGDNYLKVTYNDRSKRTGRKSGENATDNVALNCKFYDPVGHKYTLKLDRVYEPPFPGYETGGGVIFDTWHHGETGTGSPLMPKVYTLGAFWGIGDLYIDGKLAAPNHLVHVMTTEVVRTEDYILALEEQMPLEASQRLFGNQSHHTHVIVYPIKPTPNIPEGPKYRSLSTAYRLPDGQLQDFIYVMFERDQIIDGKDNLKNMPSYLLTE